MREMLTTLGELAGGFLIASGVWSYSHSLGQVTAGALLSFFCWLVAR